MGDDWAVLSPLLDQALALDEPARRQWLAALAHEQATLAAQIASLLDEQKLIEAKQFLATEPASPGLIGRPGRVVGAYTLTAPLGEGGMGTVWRARRSDGSFEGEAAVKFLNAAAVRGTASARFRREGSLLAQLAHPNIARLIDAGITDDGQPYLILEYVDGERIDAYCTRKRLDIDARVRLFLDVLAAVAEAHKKLIVHRDIKPSNVFVRRDGVVKLIDFGIAKLVDDEAADNDPLTREGASAFTPEYAAPEQIRGEPVTTVTDVYALGVLLFELLAGMRPFARNVKLALGQGVSELDVPLPSRCLAAPDTAAKRQLEGDIDNIVAKALQFEPRERYGSVDAFAEDLKRHLAHEPVTAHIDTLTYRARKFVRRHRGGVAATLLTAIALIVATVVTTLQSLEAQRQRDEARLQLRRAQASNDFVTSLLSQAGPDGRGLTPVELLDRGMDDIRLRYGDDPEFAIHMLLVLSGRYMDIDRTDKEYAALLEAESLARRSGNSASLMYVLCNTVETDLAAGRRAAAQARMEEARQLMADLDEVEPLDEVDCLRQEAALVLPQNAVAALDLLERAKTILEENDLVHGNVYSSLFSWLSVFNQYAGRLLTAHRYHEQEVDVLARLGRENTLAGVSARVGLARSWYHLGEVQRAVASYEAEGAALQLRASFEINYGLALSALDRDDEALLHIDRGAHAAAAGGQQQILFGGLYARTVALLNAERIDEAEAALAEFKASLAADTRGIGDADARELEARLAVARRDFDGAAGAADAALAAMGYPDASIGSRPATVLVLRSRIQLAQGDSAAAMAAAEKAVELLRSDVIDPAQSATVGAAMLALAQAEFAAGRDTAAREHAAGALESLANGFGADHPHTRAAAELLERS